MGFIKDRIFEDELSKYKVKCRCGHVLTITNLTEKKVCSWCGRTVYRDKKEEFKERLKNENKRICNNNN